MNKIVSINDQNLQQAAQSLKQGHLVVFPTDTVYGLAADPDNQAAINKIFQAKNRSYDNPLSVLLPSVRQVNYWVKSFPDKAQTLAEAFWPGPLTLVLPKADSINDLITANRPTIGLRMPNHPVARQLLEHFEHGLVTTSVNLSGQPSANSVEEINASISRQADLILDGGPCPLKQASTVVELTDSGFEILRQGSISESMILQLS